MRMFAELVRIIRGQLELFCQIIVRELMEDGQRIDSELLDDNQRFVRELIEINKGLFSKPGTINIIYLFIFCYIKYCVVFQQCAQA